MNGTNNGIPSFTARDGKCEGGGGSGGGLEGSPGEGGKGRGESVFRCAEEEEHERGESKGSRLPLASLELR